MIQNLFNAHCLQRQDVHAKYMASVAQARIFQANAANMKDVQPVVTVAPQEKATAGFRAYAQ